MYNISIRRTPRGSSRGKQISMIQRTIKIRGTPRGTSRGKGTLWAGTLLLLSFLSGCLTIPTGLVPKNGDCVAYGATYKYDGTSHYGVGCVESRPYPGMPQPKEDDRGLTSRVK